MQSREIEELELDLKELKFLLKEVGEDKTLAPLIKRHITRFIKSLEKINDELDVPEEVEAFIPEEETLTIEVEEQNLTEEKSVTLDEVVIAPELDDLKIEIPVDLASISPVLGERLRPATELNKSFSLNDTFRFSRELFNGDQGEMNRVLQEISEMNSLDEVISYLSLHISWDEENDTVKDFVELLKKYFV